MTARAGNRLGSHRATDRAHVVRYAGGAVLCALSNNIVLIGGDAAGLPQWASVLLAWATGGTLGYLWHHRVTFRAPPKLAGYFSMMTGGLLALPITYAVIALLHGVLRWPMWLAAPAMTVIMFGYNYLNARLAILWRGASPPEPTSTLARDDPQG